MHAFICDDSEHACSARFGFVIVLETERQKERLVLLTCVDKLSTNLLYMCLAIDMHVSINIRHTQALQVNNFVDWRGCISLFLVFTDTKRHSFGSPWTF